MGWWGEVGVKDVSSQKAQASSMVKVNEVGVENSESEGWISISEDLVVEIVTEVVQTFKVSGVMVVDSIKVGMRMGIVTKLDGIHVMVVLETLEDLGGGVVIVIQGMHGGGEGC